MVLSWYSTKNDFIYSTKVVLNVLKASNIPTITWQGTHSSLMKLITNAKVSKLDLDIQRSTMVVAHSAMEGNTYNSIVLANNSKICSWTSCLWNGNLNLSHCLITTGYNHELSITNIGMYPLTMNRTRSSTYHCLLRSLICKGFH